MYKRTGYVFFKADLSEIRGKYPVLGICYGAQFLAYTSGGNVEPANSREYGRANLSYINNEDPLLKGIDTGSQIWMSHGDTITVLPDNFKVIASTDDVKAAANTSMKPLPMILRFCSGSVTPANAL